MLSSKGRLLGDFTVSRFGDEDFLLLGSGAMQGIHMRWFESWLPENGVQIENLSDAWSGLMIAGPNARSLLAALAEDDVLQCGATLPIGPKYGVGKAPSRLPWRGSRSPASSAMKSIHRQCTRMACLTP